MEIAANAVASLLVPSAARKCAHSNLPPYPCSAGCSAGSQKRQEHAPYFERINASEIAWRAFPVHGNVRWIGTGISPSIPCSYFSVYVHLLASISFFVYSIHDFFFLSSFQHSVLYCEIIKNTDGKREVGCMQQLFSRVTGFEKMCLFTTTLLNILYFVFLFLCNFSADYARFCDVSEICERIDAN